MRTMIQWLLSQLRAGNLKVPVKVAPACNWIVLPHWAPFNAACRSSPASTVITDPGAGVCRHRTGNGRDRQLCRTIVTAGGLREQAYGKNWNE